MNILEGLRADFLAFVLQVGDLPADHALYGSRRGSDFRYHGHAPFRGDRRGRNGFERERQQTISRKNRGRFAKLFVRSRLAPSQIVVIQRRQIIVNQGIRVDELDRAAGIQCVRV